jgi:hypothetical protein
LKKFALDRQLITASKNPTKHWLIETLLAADKARTFQRLLDLPAELRKAIYEFHFSDFSGKALLHPAQPPLARTCHQLRDEVLPLFYSQCQFHIQFQQTGKWKMKLGDESSLWFFHMAADYARYIRRLKIDNQARMTFNLRLDIREDFGNADAAPLMKFEGLEKLKQDEGVWTEGIRTGLSPLIDIVKSREEGGQFQVDDVYAVRMIVEDIGELTTTL